MSLDRTARGGIGSIGGAALGGFLIGLLRAVGPPLILLGYGIPSVFSIRDAFVFLVLVLVLVFRPGGLLGTGPSESWTVVASNGTVELADDFTGTHTYVLRVGSR